MLVGPCREQDSLQPHRRLSQLLPTGLPLIIGIAYAVLACAGTWINYSPVPFWDMWNGYLEFHFRAGSGWGAWWELHNEHRLVLARALFLLDTTLFRGSLVFLFALNVAFAATLFATLAAMLTRLRPGWRDEPGTLALLGLLAVLGFSWLQRENFIWAFQSQFFLSYLLPLWSFAALSASSTAASTRRGNGWFLVAALCGIASIGTMANGLVTLPLMTAMAIALRLRWYRVVTLAVLSVLTCSYYLADYVHPPHHSSLTQVLRQDPAAFIQFLLAALGSPWYFVTGELSNRIAIAAGVVLIATSAWIFLTQPWRRPAPWQMGLIFFLLYIGAAVTGTSSGRALLGVDYAFSSRYQTPSLLAWSVLSILLVARFSSSPCRAGMRWVVPVLTVAIALSLWPYQWRALQRDESRYPRLVAALAVELGIRDDSYLDRIYFDAERLFRIAEQPRAMNLSVFGHDSIRDVRELIGQRIPMASSENSCIGYLDRHVSLPKAPDFVRIEGWIHEPTRGQNPQTIAVLSDDGTVVGYALSGQRRSDVEAARGTAARYSGFVGYLRADRAGEKLTLLGDRPRCRLTL